MKTVAGRIGMVVVALVVLLRGADVRADEPTDPKARADYYKLMQEFVTVFEQIERNYVKDVDRRVLLEAAIKGMVDKLDPYSSYIGPKDLDRFNQSVEQKFGGIGVQVRIDEITKRLTIMTPLPGTPAYKAGIRPGDTIMEIEGKSTKGFSIDDAVKLLKGEIGDPVTIGIQHVGSSKVEKIKLVRAEIQMATVLGDHYNADGTWNFFLDPAKKIGYIRLTHFSRNSADELQDAMAKLKKAGMKSLILDLRFNPGGLLSQAITIVDMFVDKGRIVSTKGKNTPEKVWDATESGTYKDFPMVVLVNRYSASASEIVSAALQDHKRATIIGERTWGKGSVQNVINIAGASSALKLTTASYHRPSGKNIHRFPTSKETDEWGVMPEKDFNIRLSLSEMQGYLDYRRDRDIMRKDGPPKSNFKDRHIDKAREILLAGNKPIEKKPTVKNGKAAPAPAKPEPAATGSSQLKLPEFLIVPRTKAA